MISSSGTCPISVPRRAATLTTVLAAPTATGPASSASATCGASASQASAAVFAAGAPLRFALVTAGTMPSKARSHASATG